MKNLSILSCLIGLVLVLTGCSSTNEGKVIHEYHIYIHTDNVMHRTHRMPPNMRRENRRFNHKPGQLRDNKKLNNPGKGIDPRYDHKPGMMPPKKTETKVEIDTKK